MNCRFFIPVFLGIILLLPIGMSNFAEAQYVPDWVKKNADWWAQGLISDKDFAAGLGFMVKERIIQVENVEFDPNGDIEISNNLQLPDWIKNNARWWADGAISDNDFKSGIQHMVKEDIISFKERQIDPPSLHLDAGPSLDPDTARLIFETAKQNEVSMKYLQKIKAAEYEMIKNAYDQVLDEYSKNKDQTTMNTMNSLGIVEKNAKEDSQRALEIYKKAIELVKQAQDNAVSSGLHVLDLEKKVSDKQSEIDSIKSSKTESEINDAYENAQESQKLANIGLQQGLSSIIANNPELQKLFTNIENDISSKIEDIEYSNLHDLMTEPRTGTVIIPELDGHDTYDPSLKEIKRPSVMPNDFYEWLTEDYDINFHPELEKNLAPLIDSKIIEGNQLITDGPPQTPTTISSGIEYVPERDDFYLESNIIFRSSIDGRIYEHEELITHPNGVTEFLSIETGDLTITYPNGVKKIIGDREEITMVYPEGEIESFTVVPSEDHWEIEIGIQYRDGTSMSIGGYGITIYLEDDSEYEQEISWGDSGIFVSGPHADDNALLLPEDPIQGTPNPFGTTIVDFFIDQDTETWKIEYSDGKIIYRHPDGTVEIKSANGEEVFLADGTLELIRADESIETRYSDGSITINNSESELEYYEETEQETSVEPEDDGFTETGEVYVGTPFVTYSTGVWNMIIGNERHEFDSRDAALAAVDELVTQFKAAHSPQTTESGSDEIYKWVIGVKKIGNLIFPAFQFMLSPPDSGCSESYLSPASWHTGYQNVAFQLDPFTTPVPWISGGCGSFAKESQHTFIEDYPITDEQATIWEETFGISMKHTPYSP